MEFWNENISDKSWEKLVELNKEFDFVLIGGWATFIYARLIKSKDIDLITDYDGLKYLNSKYTVSKNDILNKYEIKEDFFDIDIYIPYYSKLALPAEDILKKFRVSVEGFSLPTKEALLTLKFSAFVSRKNSVKGRKDKVDIIGLLVSGFDGKKLIETWKEYKHTSYINELKYILDTVDNNLLEYLNLNTHSFSKERKRILDEIDKFV